jgi:hypothetical protein
MKEYWIARGRNGSHIVTTCIKAFIVHRFVCLAFQLILSILVVSTHMCIRSESRDMNVS